MVSVSKLFSLARKGDRAALARLLSLAERGQEVAAIESAIAQLPHRAHVIGVTGPPGAGKSTLINALLPVMQADVSKAAVLTVDPSSPVSGGAILGDRVRMQVPAGSNDVFIRSMASRGEIGGLAKSAALCVRLFDACDWPVIIIETLGIGQVELDIIDLADTVVIALNPGWGDIMQANKAGLTEVGDVFVINKADKAGVQQTRKNLLESLSLLHKVDRPEVVETVATNATGMDALWTAICEHFHLLGEGEELIRQRQHRQQRLLHKQIRRGLQQRLDDLLTTERAQVTIAHAGTTGLSIDAAITILLSQLSQADKGSG